ncbi:alpha/beta hydrolase [Spirochaetota bacterium]
MEENIYFESNRLNLEGIVKKGNTGHGIVISHPHPQFGGSMHNNVIDTINNVYSKKGYTTLRFNFRGTGASEGTYDNGIGEREDVKGAVDFLMDLGISEIALAGYSFGAWVNAHAISLCSDIKEMIMVSPPVGSMDFSSIAGIDQLKLVVCGSHDQFAPADQIRDIVPKWNSETKIEIIDNADHFFMGYEEKLESVLSI